MARMLVLALLLLTGCKSTHEVKTELSYEPGPQPTLKGLKVTISASEKW